MRRDAKGATAGLGGPGALRAGNAAAVLELRQHGPRGTARLELRHGPELRQPAASGQDRAADLYLYAHTSRRGTERWRGLGIDGAEGRS
jgi:hypothetical protein